jgi:hypothetical protein
VTNGGYGGVQYALRYGVPIVATGGKEDKPEVGARRVVRRRTPHQKRKANTARPTPRHSRRAESAAVPASQPARSGDLAAAPRFSCLADVVDGLIGDPARASN